MHIYGTLLTFKTDPGQYILLEWFEKKSTNSSFTVKMHVTASTML